MNIKVITNGIDNVMVKLNTLARKIPVDLFEAVRDAAYYAEYTSKELVPVDTGRLRSSISTVNDNNGTTIKFIVGTNVFYAPYQEFGTSRGIRPKRFMQGGFEMGAIKLGLRLREITDGVK